MNAQPMLDLVFEEPEPAEKMYKWTLGKLHGIGTMDAILGTMKPERHGGKWMIEVSPGKMEVLVITEDE